MGMCIMNIKDDRAYNTWRGMIERCGNPRHIGYKYYGARGISVCAQWRKSFATFLADMGPRPRGCSIDRIDSDGNYEPTNCRWSTPSGQRTNQRPYDESVRVRRSWETGKRSKVSHARGDLSGKRFGRLLVLQYAETRDKRAWWLCLCDCGTEKAIRGKSLRNGTARSCGCAQFDAIKQIAASRTNKEQRTRALKGWQTRKMTGRKNHT